MRDLIARDRSAGAVITVEIGRNGSAETVIKVNICWKGSSVIIVIAVKFERNGSAAKL